MRKIIAILSASAVILISLSCAGIKPDAAPGDGIDLQVSGSPVPETVGAIDELALQIGDEDDRVSTGQAELNGGQGPDAAFPPKAPPLGRAALLALVKAQMPWNMILVHDDGVPFTVIHDLDKNGYDDALVLCVEGDSGTDASRLNLSESSRLFEAEKEYYDYFLLIFYQYSEDLILRYTIPVSRQLVFDGMTPFEIKKDSDFPYALLISFRTRSGLEKELVILSGYGITGLTLRENLSEFSHIEDIDDDGYIDIIIHEQGFEEGTGFETFLTWYKWNSKEYAEYKNTNIVRNLREFFSRCSLLLKEGSFEAFFEYALDEEALRELKKQGLTDTDIIKRVFKTIDENSGWDDFVKGGSFSAVVFPEIMETPFSYDSRNEFRHTVSVRFSRQGGDSQICLSELRMKQNPFQDKQFCFCPGTE